MYKNLGYLYVTITKKILNMCNKVVKTLYILNYIVTISNKILQGIHFTEVILKYKFNI